MPCLVHLDANGEATHTNRHCKFVNDLKEDPESGYKQSRKNRPRGKGKGKKKEEDSKDSSDMDKDIAPKRRQGRRQGQEPLRTEGSSLPPFPWHPYRPTTED